MEEIKDKLIYILNSEEFENFYKEYILPIFKLNQNQEKEIDLLESYLEKLENPECFIAILGVQGSGKSSLLNALIFEDDFLPVEVEETTCIPTLIKKLNKNEKPGIKVHYQDGRIEDLPFQKSFIEKVVDNRYNPGNIMNVSFVECKVDSSFLKEGFIFVDLPGVGSLTEKNEKTTLEFLQQTHIGIFLLRTVPPITESEASFIRIAWPRLQESIFVQNLWAKETEEEVNQGIEHNKKVLEKIAEERETEPPAHILKVNIALACEGVYKNDKELIKKSGLEELRKYLRQYAKHSALTLLYQQTAKYFIKLIEKAQEQIEERFQILNQDRNKILEELEKAKKEFLEKKEELEENLIRHCEKLAETLSEIKIEWLTEKLEESSKKIYQRLDELPLEEMKEEEFRTIIRETFSEIFGIVYKELKNKLAQTSQQYIENLSEALEKVLSLDKISERFNIGKKEKGAKGWSIALAGSIAPLVVSGPVGWGILGGSLLAGGLVRWISGATAHKRLMRGIKKTLGDTKRKIKEDLKKEIDKFSNNIIDVIKENVYHELHNYAIELEKIQEDLEKKDEEKEKLQKKLREDLKLSELFLNTLLPLIK